MALAWYLNRRNQCQRKKERHQKRICRIRTGEFYLSLALPYSENSWYFHRILLYIKASFKSRVSVKCFSKVVREFFSFGGKRNPFNVNCKCGKTDNLYPISKKCALFPSSTKGNLNYIMSYNISNVHISAFYVSVGEGTLWR